MRKFYLLPCWLLSAPLWAATPEFELVIRDHLFFPSTLEVPAGVKVRLMVDNQDETPEEFESYELNREKVIPGNSRTAIFIGPLKPGEYPFFGEFYPKTAQGRVIAK
ncbi:MAG: cupredoxin domain-containing protein [Pseudomonadales bacterium]|jgi:hypothetical protein|nr:cupredoxin domain-containing protein [Pseudomonadales bacterium]